MASLYYDDNMNVNQQVEVKDIDRLGMMLFFAAVMHAIFILGFGFDFLDNAKLEAPPSLEVILVQTQNSDTPEEADYLAQVSQDGGGESEERLRPSEAFAATEPTEETGVSPQPLEQQVQQQTPEQQEVITRLFSTDEIESKKKPDPKSELTDIEKQLQALELQIAKQTTELKLTSEKYAKLPKVLQVTARTKEYAPAAYMAAWVDKVERIGNVNYPKDARLSKLQGDLLLEVEIKSNGQVVETKILRSSGSSILDEAAKRTIRLASPFPPFTAELSELADQIEIVRTWIFKQGDLSTR